MAPESTTKHTTEKPAQHVMDIVPNKKDEAQKPAQQPDDDKSPDEKAVEKLLNPSSEPEKKEATQPASGSVASPTTIATPPPEAKPKEAHPKHKIQMPKEEKPKVAPAKPAHSQGDNDTKLAIIASVVVATILGILMVYAFLRSNNVSFF